MPVTCYVLRELKDLRGKHSERSFVRGEVVIIDHFFDTVGHPAGAPSINMGCIVEEGIALPGDALVRLDRLDVENEQCWIVKNPSGSLDGPTLELLLLDDPDEQQEVSVPQLCDDLGIDKESLAEKIRAGEASGKGFILQENDGAWTIVEG